MRMATAVLPASLWLLLVARGFDRSSVEGAMTIAGWAMLGVGPAGLPGLRGRNSGCQR